jgi:GT2 family glycosyltransferase
MIEVIIINWNSGLMLSQCIQSVLNTDINHQVDSILVVDNASSDDSMQHLPESNKVKCLYNSQNVGFARACNQGFQLTHAPFVLLLNPDAQVFKNTLHDCMLFMQSNPNIDILGCQLMNERGEVSASCARFPKPYRYFFHAIGFTRILPSVFHPPTLMSDWDHLSDRQVDQVMGAFMFMRRSVFDRIGYFDERFFVYYEELDFSLRLKQAGGISYFNATIKAMHTGGGTTREVLGFRLFLSLRSRLLYARKHFSLFGYGLVLLSTCLIEPVIRLAFLCVRFRIKEISSWKEGYVRLFRWLVFKSS